MTVLPKNGRFARHPQRVALLGIGQELRGDDGAGVAVARGLSPLAHPRFLVIEAGHAPENHTAPLRRFRPDLVLLVDAAEMGDRPGTVRWLAWEETSGLSASTHTLPLYMLARYLVHAIGCEVVLVGIQPAHTDLDRPLSPAVAGAVGALSAGLRTALHRSRASVVGTSLLWVAVAGLVIVGIFPGFPCIS